MSKLAQYTNIIDRSLDRWENAVEAARSATYTGRRFAVDVAECWADWAQLAALPLSVFGVDASVRPAVPIVEFVVTDKTTNQTQVVAIPQISGVTGAAPQNLTKPGGGGPPGPIPAARVTASLAGNEYLYVTLDVIGIAAITTPPITVNVYRGDIIGTGVNVAIAHVKVVWPG